MNLPHSELPSPSTAPQLDAFGHLTGASYIELRARMAHSAAGGAPLSAMDTEAVHRLLERLEAKMDVRVMADGYDFLVGSDYKVFALTAGDQHYEDARLELNLSGWQMLDESNDPRKMDPSDWQSHWQAYEPGMSGGPGLLEVVVVKTPAGVVSLDWLQSFRYPENRLGHFSHNHGMPAFWMPRAEFDKFAPAWAKEHCHPLSEETLAHHTALVTGLAESASSSHQIKD